MQPESTPAPLPAPSTLEGIVQQRFLPWLDALGEQLLAQGRALQLCGEPVFTGRDKFLPGKIAMALCWRVLGTPAGSAARTQALADFARVATLTLADDNESWGMYYYLAALNRLREAGLLDAALDTATLARLHVRLDWRRFVDADTWRLRELPTNYYGVAFSIARLRHLLGWEDAHASEVLLEKTLAHYEAYSGEFGFSDETEGDGRFDRYSILLVAEISQRCLETGLTPDPRLRGWLRSAAEVALAQLTHSGSGFSFGRSIGAYGDTAVLEILATAARMALLNADERELALAFAVQAARRFADFWFDPAMGSVNLWDHGRRTDAYRGRHRLLGENLSLLHQHLYTAAIWSALGEGSSPPCADFAARLARLPRARLTRFARQPWARALLTLRGGAHVFSLPAVNGALGYHDCNPYFPIPFCDGLIQGVADAHWPQLLPRLTLDDGSQLIPAVFFDAIELEEQGDAVLLHLQQAACNRLGGRSPVADARVGVRTTWRFTPGRIEREDHFIPQPGCGLIDIELEFASYSRAAQREGAQVRFGEGPITTFTLHGLLPEEPREVTADPDYHTPTGPLQTCVRAEARVSGKPFSIGWTLDYLTTS